MGAVLVQVPVSPLNIFKASFIFVLLAVESRYTINFSITYNLIQM